MEEGKELATMVMLSPLVGGNLPLPNISEWPNFMAYKLGGDPKVLTRWR